MPPVPLPSATALAHVAALCKGPALDDTLRVTLNFHPDRLHRGRPLLQALLADGVYRSQFETGSSNGGLTAFPGGVRWQWESRIFGGAYDACPPAERPKYGALNALGRACGAAPRFGSACLRLKPEVLGRTTFCYGGSAIEALARQLPCALEWHAGFRLATDVLRAHPAYRGHDIVDLGMRIAQDGWLDPLVVGQATGETQALKKVWHYVARFGDLSIHHGTDQVGIDAAGQRSVK